MKLPKKTSFTAAKPSPRALGASIPVSKGNAYGKPTTPPAGKKGSAGKLKKVL